MKQSVGYTVTINIIIIFIVVIFAFISSVLIYYKSNKISNVVTNSIEKFEGYNSLSKNEIEGNMESLGYLKNSINCSATVSDKGKKCNLQKVNGSDSSKSGYCVYLCIDEDKHEYYYKIRTNMVFNIPIINNILNLPIYSNTNRLYDFSDKF